MKNNPKHSRDFIVRESIVLLIIIAVFFLSMLGSFIEYNTSAGIWGYLIIAALIPPLIFFIRKKIKVAVITINKNGIYSYKKLITDWRDFRNAKIDQLPMNVGDPRDKVVLIIHYYNPAKEKIFEQQLRLNNTLNKSEEQILAAIELFRNVP